MFPRERKQLAQGKIPKTSRDFQWKEESFDFPTTFGKKNYDLFGLERTNETGNLGVKYVRGGEIFEVKDEENIVLNDFSR